MKIPAICLAFALGAAVTSAPAQDANVERIQRSVRREILTLPYYGVFDWITFQVDGTRVTLNGMVSRPTLKSGAERVTQKIEGVQAVTNNIEVLPVSPNDDRIRRAVANAIFRHSAMTRYAIRGSNAPIHILVKNGNVTLEGIVALESEKNIAGIQANGVSGVFSVTNNLLIEPRPARKAKKK